MEQEQASSQLARQNSAQNPTPPSSSAATTASSPQNAAANGTPKVETETPEAETSVDDPVCLGKENTSLPSLPNPSNGKAKAVEENVVLVNISPWTNLSRHAVTDEMVFGPIPDREYHEGFMRKAIEMAQLALDSDETPVGCVFVRDGEVIGRGINGTNASLNVSTLLFFFALDVHFSLEGNEFWVAGWA